MKFVGIKELRYHPKEIIESMNTGNEVIITMNGKPKAIMTPVEGSQIEQYLKAIRQTKAFMALSNIQESSIKKGTDKISDKEINQEIKAVRKHRRAV